MKQTFLIVAILLSVAAFGLSACGTSTPAPIPTVVLDGASPADSSGDGPSAGSVSASGEVVPVEKVNLSFQLTGAIKTVEVKVGDTVAAGDVLATLDTTILDARVAEAEANVAAAETQVRYLRRVAPADEHLDAAIADIDAATAVLNQIKATLAQATLTAPIGGTVVTVDAAPGETAVPGKVLVVIGNLSDMRIETTDLSERDIAAVQVGQQATAFIEALGGEFEGKVVDIARTSQIVGGDVVYQVTIALAEQPKGLRWGMSADVSIQTEQ